ncbi:MAG: restriction endonuclease subunit S [Clostridium sp.]
MEKKNVPKIRFPGFTEPWEQRKLSELATIHARIGWQNLRTSEFLDNGDYMLITGTDFKDGAINYSTCHYVEKERYDQDKHIQINNGSILITKDGTLGKVAYVQGLTMPATLNAGIFNVQIRNENEVDGKYLFQYLKAPYLMNYVSQKATGGTIKHLNQNILVDFPIVLPNKFEQVKIGTFFEKLDKLITLHHRKLENLKKQKKGLLQKMFPEKGKKVPEIRFPEFTNDWEQRKLEEYLIVSTEKNKDNTYDKGDVLSVSGDYGIVNQIEFQGRSFAGVFVSNYGVVHTGDIVYTKSPLKCNPYGIIKTNKGKVGIVSTLYAVYHPKKNIFSNFVQTYFELHTRMNNYMNPLVNKGAKNDMKVSSQNALKGNVIFPSYEEQKTISEFFTNLDNLISLHQRKLEHLQKQKKALLQQMFV